MTLTAQERTPVPPANVPCGDCRVDSPRGRWIIAATVLGSGVAFLDGTIVNVALPKIQANLGASFTELQWVLDAYLLTLGSLILVGGALGDLFGRKKMFLVGLVGFGIASLACGLAPTATTLILARGLQGVAAALLVPGSLAIITSSFDAAERGRAIGTWSGLSGVSTALGPFAGGYLIDVASWRWAFLINGPLIAAAIVATIRHVPESRAPAPPGESVISRLDLPGAITAALGLALVVYALIEVSRLRSTMVALLIGVGVALLIAFIQIERRRRMPMLPLHLFRSREFVAANVITLLVYGGLTGTMFLLALELQNVLGYSALEGGAAFLPFTVLLLVLSPRVGALLPRMGMRVPLTLGPLITAAGLLLLVRVDAGSSYLTDILPPVVLFSLGMCLVVAPVTTAALGAVDPAWSGIASGVNNAVARIAGLVAIAVLPLAAGLSQGSVGSFTEGFHRAMVIGGAIFVAGGVAALIGLPSRAHKSADSVEA
ncbi:MAG: hypothetical protein QOG53_1672 [Frankiales bacterium]|jgi:EmrB/QacA subfamily drug resistance transporter|nr:hypothetical protein [Frankiales bacterium]